MKKVFSLIVVLIFTTGLYAEFRNLTPVQLEKAIEKGVPVIDIRRLEEWQQTGVVPTSHKLTFFDAQGEYDVPVWMQEFSRIVKDKEQPFVLVCRSGNRTSVVGKFLSEQMAYKNVYHLQHGIKSWIKEKKRVNK